MGEWHIGFIVLVERENVASDLKHIWSVYCYCNLFIKCSSVLFGVATRQLWWIVQLFNLYIFQNWFNLCSVGMFACSQTERLYVVRCLPQESHSSWDRIRLATNCCIRCIFEKCVYSVDHCNPIWMCFHFILF